MRGDDRRPEPMFSYVSAEERIPQDHPLRAIRALVDEILRDMSRDFSRVYATTGRPSIPPEQLLRALLLQIFYSIRSERLLMEQLEYNILFRWFVGLTMDDAVWAPTVFTKNRDRRAERRHRRPVLPARGRAGAAVHVRRAFHRRRHAHRGVGEPEEFSDEGRRRPTAMAGISTARRARTTRTPRRPIPTPSCIARPRMGRRGWPISGTC